MPCFFAILTLTIPRVFIVGLWLLSDWFSGLFDTLLWPILGFFFAPTILLWYSVVMNFYGGEWGTLQLVGLVIAGVIDFSPASSRRKGKE